MRARSILISLFLFLCLSCASHEMTYRLEADTTAQERAYVVKAMTAWNAETTEDYQMSLAPDPAEAEWTITFTDDDTVLRQGIDGRTCGRHADPQNDCARDHWIRVRRGMYAGGDGTRPVVITTHELGHSLGLSHVGDPDALMYGGYITATHLTGVDRAACVDAGPCGSITIRAIGDTPAQ